MPTISLVGLPASRTEGWPNSRKVDSSEKKIALTSEEIERQIKEAKQRVKNYAAWDCNNGSSVRLLRGVFAPPMDIEPIVGPID